MNAMQNKISERNHHSKFSVQLNRLIPLAMWGTPVVIFAILLPLTLGSENATVAPPQPEFTKVGQRLQDYKTSATADISYGPISQVRSAASGLVTNVNVTEGGTVKMGDQLASISGVPVFAQVGTSPFFRDMMQGQEGVDILALHQFLSSVGIITDASSSRFDRSTKSAVGVFQQRIGQPKDGVFRPGYVAFVPSNATLISTVDLSLNMQVAPGDLIYSSSRPIESIKLANAEPSTGLSALAGQSVQLTAGSDKVVLSGLELTPDDLAAAATFVESGLASGTLTADETGATASARGTVRGLLVALAEPLRAGAVPGTAIYVSASGDACLFVKGSGRTIRARALPHADFIPSSEIGVTFVPIDEVGKTILVNGLSAPSAAKASCK